MATTDKDYTITGATPVTSYSFDFPYMKAEDVQVELNGIRLIPIEEEDLTDPNDPKPHKFTRQTTQIELVDTPTSGDKLRIYRATDDSGLTSTFYPGSAIRSGDLNDNFTQNLYSTQENTNDAAKALENSRVLESGDYVAAITKATQAVTTANTAETNATAAVSTANTASTNASAAVTTANTASTTANTASTNASTALTTANAADTKADTAITTANSATTTANAASTTATTADTNASAAVITANTASTNASSAVTTANTASTNATTAVNTANQAAADVADAVLYTSVANKADLEALTPSADGDYQVTDSSSLANATWGIYTLSGLGSSYPTAQLNGITTRLNYTHSSNTFAFASYFANDSDDRYMVGPASDGSNGQYLQTNGAGVKTWATVDTSTLAPSDNPTFTGTVTTSDVSIHGDIVLEGSTEDVHETTIAVTDPTADRTITLPDASGTVALTTGANFTGTVVTTGIDNSAQFNIKPGGEFFKFENSSAWSLSYDDSGPQSGWSYAINATKDYVRLYGPGSSGSTVVLETKTGGVDITGGLDVSGAITSTANTSTHTLGGTLEVGGPTGTDNGVIKLRTRPFNITANSSGIAGSAAAGYTTYNTIIQSGSEDLFINVDNNTKFIVRGSVSSSQGNQGTEELARFTPGAGVELLYDNSKKLEITSGGVNVTGDVTTTGEGWFANNDVHLRALSSGVGQVIVDHTTQWQAIVGGNQAFYINHMNTMPSHSNLTIDWDGNYVSTGGITISGVATGGVYDATTDASAGAGWGIDFADGNNQKVTLVSTNVFTVQPTNQTVGQSGSIFITQPASPASTVSTGWHGDFKWAGAGGAAQNLTQTNGATDRLDYVILAANTIHVVLTLGVA